MLPEARIITYSEGVSGPNPTKVLVGLTVAAIAAAGALYLVMPALIIPGVLLIFLVKNVINPGKGVVVDNFGLAIVDKSMLTGKPRSSIGRIPHQNVPPFEKAGSRTLIRVTEAPIWVSKSEFGIIQAGLSKTQQPLKTS